MIRHAILMGLALVFVREAAADAGAAASTPRLKELATVASEIVRIGDLVEHAGAAASVPVFRAPDLGQTGSVPVARVLDALRPHAVTGLETGGLSEVVVTRLSRAITGREIAERLTRAFAGRFGLSDETSLAVTIDRDVPVVHVEASATAELAIAHMRLDRRNGRFDVALEVPGSAVARRLRLRFTGTVVETADATILARAIRRGESVREADVQTARRPKSEIPNDALGIDQIAGLAATRALRAGQILRPGDLVKPQAVQRNEEVTILYQVPGVTLTVRGKALEPGAVGDVVAVLNVRSSRTIQATVDGPGRVSVGAILPFVAAAAAPATHDSTSPRTQ